MKYAALSIIDVSFADDFHHDCSSRRKARREVEGQACLQAAARSSLAADTVFRTGLAGDTAAIAITEGFTLPGITPIGVGTWGLPTMLNLPHNPRLLP